MGAPRSKLRKGFYDYGSLHYPVSASYARYDLLEGHGECERKHHLVILLSVSG
jgi:hypothetical protein